MYFYVEELGSFPSLNLKIQSMLMLYLCEKHV